MEKLITSCPEQFNETLYEHFKELQTKVDVWNENGFDHLELLPMITVYPAYVHQIASQKIGGFKVYTDEKSITWHMINLSNGAFYLQAQYAGKMIMPDAFGLEFRVTADAASIAVNLLALNWWSWRAAEHNEEELMTVLNDLFYKLRDYALEHPE